MPIPTSELPENMEVIIRNFPNLGKQDDPAPLFFQTLETVLLHDRS